MSASPTVFIAGSSGPWSVVGCRAIRGETLAHASRLAVHPAHDAPSTSAGNAWSLSGVVSNLRYATRREVDDLSVSELPLQRPGATRAVLIPIRKSPAWWAMAQDERDGVFSAASRHAAIGAAYADGIARKLYHSRDLGEPFDFLTWFEFEPTQQSRFDELLDAIRRSAEWRYVEREVEIHLERDDTWRP